MRILVSGATATLRTFPVDCPHLGHLLVPAAGNDASAFERPWAADNGAFAGFDKRKFLSMLSKIVDLPHQPLFVTAPDVVAMAEQTLRMFRVWGPVIRELGLKAALVGQDGLSSTTTPWDDFDALFIGGSTEWKLGNVVADLCLEAKERGKHVHIGRVNTKKRMKRFIGLKADTIDGTKWSRFSATYLPRAVRWLERETTTATLFA